MTLLNERGRFATALPWLYNIRHYSACSTCIRRLGFLRALALRSGGKRGPTGEAFDKV